MSENKDKAQAATTPSAAELEWEASVRRGLESGDPAYRMLVSSLMISVAAMESAHRAQSEAQALTTPSAAELRDRYGCEVVVSGSDVLDDDPWKDPRGYVGHDMRKAVEAAENLIATHPTERVTTVRPDGSEVVSEPFTGMFVRTETTETTSRGSMLDLDYSVPKGEWKPTVAEKWAEHIGNRAANLEWMAQAIETQVSEHEWRTARTQLRAMRDEIDKALAEIEPLAVEQGGGAKMSDKIAIRLCVDTGFSHDPVACLWYRYLGVWAAYHAEKWAGECSDGSPSEAAVDWMHTALNSDFAPDELVSPDPKIRNGGDWPTVRIAFVPGGYRIYVERIEGEEVLLRQIHGHRGLRATDAEWIDIFDNIERGRHWL